MKKKKFALMGIALLATVGLASCTDKEESTTSAGPSTTPSTEPTQIETGTSTETSVTPTSTTPTEEQWSLPTTPLPDKDMGRLDISVTYSTTEGITLQKVAQFTNIVDQKNYVKGDLLPTWQAFAEKTRTTIYDAASYNTKDNDTYTAVKTNGFKSETDADQYIDLLFFKTGKINEAGKASEMEDLVPYMTAGKMPYFSKWLENEPAIEKQLKQSNGAIYYTPYFDGYNDVERMLNMDTKLVARILDSADGDTEGTNGGANPSANLVQKAAYVPFIDANKNMPANGLEIEVVNAAGDEAETITLKQTDNIIKQQNTLLTQGCTGKQLADQFRTYLDTVFGDYIGEGKLYTKRSEIFTSKSAGYNVDELIALMRVVKANPFTLTNDKNQEIECLIPRGKTNNRIDNIMDFGQVWGVQGLTAEKDMLYFSPDVKLQDAATTKQTYDVLTQLGQIYAEGLIVGNFWQAPASGKGSTEYLDQYWKKITTDAGYALLMYDYSATQSAANDLYEGLGTDEASRTIKYKSTGIMPILPPITWWNSETSWTRNDSLTDFSHKSLMRYSEENRALKDSSWAVPTTSDNKEAAILLMDFLFSTEGQLIQDFGPKQYWAGYDAETGKYTRAKLVAEEAYDPRLSTETLQMLATSKYDFWTFMRDILGATHGIGSVRSKTLQIVACNHYAQEGAANLAAAISTGVVMQGLVQASYEWACTVPTTYDKSVDKTVAATYDNLTNFWASDKCGNDNGWVRVIKSVADGTLTDSLVVCQVGEANVTWADIRSASVWAVKDQSYLYTLSSSLGDQYVPSFAKSN